jgi:hypothetical protein
METLKACRVICRYFYKSKVLICILTGMLNNNVANTQETIQIQLKTKQNIYDAEIQIKTDQKDTVWDGSAIFKAPLTYHDSLGIGFDFEIVYGQFDQNKASGIWKIRQGSMEREATGNFEPYRYICPVNGVEWSAWGNLERQTEPTKTWTFDEVRIQNSKPTDTLMHARFSSDLLESSKTLSIYQGAELLSCRFDHNGITSGFWKHYQKSQNSKDYELFKVWHFEKGELVKISNFKDGMVIEDQLTFADTTFSKLIEVDLDENYFFKILLIHEIMSNRLCPFPNQYLKAEKLLFEMREKFSAIDSSIFQLTQQRILPELKAYIRLFPLNEDEIKQLIGIQNEIDRLTERIQSVQKNKQIQVAKATNPSVSIALKKLAWLEHALLYNIKLIPGFSKNQMLEYIPRKSLVEFLISYETSFIWRNGMESFEWDKDQNDRLIYSFGFEPKSNDEPLKKVEEYAKAINRAFDEILEEIDAVISKIKND